MERRRLEHGKAFKRIRRKRKILKTFRIFLFLCCLPASPSSPNAQLERRKLGKLRKSFCCLMSLSLSTRQLARRAESKERKQFILRGSFYAHECLCSFVKSFGGWRASDKSRAGCKSLNFFFVSDDDFWRCKWKCMLISSTDVLCERPSIKSDARNDTVDVTDK